MKKYFLYELKKSAFTIGCLSLIAVALYITPILTSTTLLSRVFGTYLWFISTIGGVLAVCVPIWIYAYKMKKRSVDLYYSLPLSHQKILLVKFLIGLVAVYVPYTVAYWLGAITVLIKVGSEIPTCIYYIPQYFSSIIPIYFIYAISSFVFTRANKLIDGIVFLCFWAFVFMLVAALFEKWTWDIMQISDFQQTNFAIYPVCYAPFAPLDWTTTRFQELMLQQNATSFDAAELANVIVGFSLTALQAVGATLGLFFMEKRAKAENCEQISDSVFGYKTMIPLYTAGLLALYDFSLGAIFSDFFLILFVFTAVASFAITAIYKRTFKIERRQAVIYGVALEIGVLLSLL